MKIKTTKEYGSLFEGPDAFLLSELARDSNSSMLFAAHSDERMYRIANQLSFFAPKLRIILFPAWDCLPYDRVSPSVKVVSKRLESLSEILSSKSKFLVITSVAAIMQKLPAKEVFAESFLKVKPGDKLNRDGLIRFLIEHGFIRTDVANEPGDFSVRGSIIDIFDSGKEEGWRLDFFGDEIDSIRSFNPETQVSTSKIQSINILPASEIFLKEENIDRFKQKYKEAFDTPGYDDPLYEAVSEGRKYAGLEHWLPLFYEKLDTIFEYLPKKMEIVLDSDSLESAEEHKKLINDYYDARIKAKDLADKDSVVYHPMQPEQMWADLKLDNVISFNMFNVGEDAGFKAIPRFYSDSKLKNISPFDLLKEYSLGAKRKNLIACASKGGAERFKSILESHNFHFIELDSFEEKSKVKGKTVGLMVFPIEHGFETDEFRIVSEQDILGKKISTRAKKSKKKIENLMSEAASLAPGEIVVHNQHGIGRFEGLHTVTVLGAQHDCLLIIYDGNDKLYVPVENIDAITRHGSQEVGKLDKLGAASWQARKAKLKKRIKIIAEDLMRIAAMRHLKKAPVYIAVKGLYDEFCARFPYVETEDQLNAISDVEDDLAAGKPMDRLICGDVGFGKTEVAMRASFVATHAEDGEKTQAAIIVPTTLLARQHFQNFRKRFEGLGVNVRQLSRMVTTKEAFETKRGLEDGSVDIVIGTHTLLAKNIKFKNLGLVIVDEEQHFGVAQKEKLKSLKNNVHLLTLSATPIPRTLQMSLTSIRDLSLIATPPVDRLAVRTYVMPQDEVVIREAIMREHFRGGQTFYVCPRIKDLADIERMLKKITPEIKIVKAHGQMPPDDLDQIMTDFYLGKFDVLLSTTIVGSGLDIPTANTIIIHRSDMFGLAGLYQLRGRVGRSKVRAHAYLTTPKRKKLNKGAMQRLQVMQALDTLGAGFSVASHDMDIRGFGNLVGDEQSGHVKEVGIELYQDMLKEAVASLSTEKEAQEDWSPQVNIGLSVMIPEEYVQDIALRMGLYRRAAALKSEEEVEGFASEMIDRFGPIPESTEHLFKVMKVKLACKRAFVEKIDAGAKGIIFTFKDNIFPEAEKLLAFVMKNSHSIKLRGDQKLVFLREFGDFEKRLEYIAECLRKLEELALKE